MDPRLADAIETLYRASVQRGERLETEIELHDMDHTVISSLHDLVLAEQSNVTPIRGAG